MAPLSYRHEGMREEAFRRFCEAAARGYSWTAADVARLQDRVRRITTDREEDGATMDLSRLPARKLASSHGRPPPGELSSMRPAVP